jgi:hypothetical protein
MTDNYLKKKNVMMPYKKPSEQVREYVSPE